MTHRPEPILYFQARNTGELALVVGDHYATACSGLCGDKEILGSYQLSLALERGS